MPHRHFSTALLNYFSGASRLRYNPFTGAAHCVRSSAAKHEPMSTKRWNTESYITACKLVHSTFYDYSATIYVSKRVKVTVVCPKHGPWKVLPLSHLQGSGCLQCSREKNRLGKAQFIKRAQLVHGAGRYFYELVEYRSSRAAVKIICPREGHGEFLQAPTSHLRGAGCPLCAVEAIKASQRASREEIMARAVNVHGDRYDYSKVNYINIDTPVLIHCRLHGPFYQTPYQHIQNKCGCPECGLLGRATSKRTSADEYEQRALEVHNSRYSYPRLEAEIGKSQLVRATVTVICPDHGEFAQNAANHLYGAACPKCGLNRCTSVRAITREKLLERLTDVHGSTYSYLNLEEYRDTSSRLRINCPDPTHPPFEQTVREHLQGRGCRRCGHIRRGAQERSMFVASFLSRASVLHREANYTYPQLATELTGARSMITVKCPRHGIFRQNATGHLTGRGCAKCGRKRASKKFALTVSEVLAKAIDLHGNKGYLYPNIDEEYHNRDSVITITCPIHGDFRQKVAVHIDHGCGCQRCGVLSVIENPDAPGVLYLLRFSGDEEFVKVGWTGKSIKHRWVGSKSARANGLSWEVLYELKGTVRQVTHLEGIVLSRFAEHQIIPKTLKGGKTECFRLLAEQIILDFIRELGEMPVTDRVRDRQTVQSQARAERQRMFIPE